MTRILVIILALVLIGCGKWGIGLSNSLTEDELEAFFRAHKISGKKVVALKKRSAGSVSYLATIHGYPDNLSVCEELIKPYNENPSMSILPGAYYCEELVR
jgi:hypothetical protein